MEPPSIFEKQNRNMELSDPRENGTVLNVSAGFKEDCMKLVSSLQSKDDINFQSFCEIWKDMEFSNIFMERMMLAELLEFCEDTLDIAKEFVSVSRSLKDRISGIYLLYALYFRMPVQPQPPIRMTIYEWQNLMHLKNSLINQNLFSDAVFIIDKLTEINAFAHCLCDKDRGLEEYFDDKESIGGNKDGYHMDGEEHVLPEGSGDIELTEIFNDISQLSRNYIEKKLNSRKSRNLIPRLYQMVEVDELVSGAMNVGKSPRELRHQTLTEKRNKNSNIS